jgi:hypothetical protein
MLQGQMCAVELDSRSSSITSLFLLICSPGKFINTQFRAAYILIGSVFIQRIFRPLMEHRSGVH